MHTQTKTGFKRYAKAALIMCGRIFGGFYAQLYAALLVWLVLP